MDPWKPTALAELRRAREALGLHGSKFDPSMQAFRPNDDRFAGLFQQAAGKVLAAWEERLSAAAFARVARDNTARLLGLEAGRRDGAAVAVPGEPLALEWVADGWHLRFVRPYRATKVYRCPGCNQEIFPRTLHVVAGGRGPPGAAMGRRPAGSGASPSCGGRRGEAARQRRVGRPGMVTVTPR